MDINRIYLFLLTVLTNFSFEIFAEDFQTAEPTTTEIITSTIPTPTVPIVAKFYTTRYGNLRNATNVNKNTFKGVVPSQSAWEPVPEPSYKFGYSTRKRPRCCRRVREKAIMTKDGRQIKCRNGSVMFKDEKGIRRRRCRRRRRCKRRCKKYYEDSAWSIMESVMKGFDYFLPKMQFKFHTGTLIFGTKMFSGLVPFMQAKIKAMKLVFALFEPLLDGVLEVMDFGRSSFRDMTGMSDDDEDEEEENDGNQKGNQQNQNNKEKEEENSGGKGDSDEDDDDDDEDDEDEGIGDLWRHNKNGADEQTEPIDEDYGIDSDWADEDSGNDDDENEYYDELEEVKYVSLRPKPPKRTRRPILPLAKPTRFSLPAITPPTDLEQAEMINDESSQTAIANFIKKLRESGNLTAYHGHIDNLEEMIANKLPMTGDKTKIGMENIDISALIQQIQAQQKLNSSITPNLNPILNQKKPGPLLGLQSLDNQFTNEEDDDGDDSSGIDQEWDDGDKLVVRPSLIKKTKTKNNKDDFIFSSFKSFFSAIAEAFDSYFESTY